MEHSVNSRRSKIFLFSCFGSIPKVFSALVRKVRPADSPLLSIYNRK
ncbi:hypothetical protein EVA_04205 [gut metagenome]|uniref:Uncharacterized protein n=1 Tax=gut metagenome TaxID=749906 RepID=J9GJ55_9ZZZZ